MEEEPREQSCEISQYSEDEWLGTPTTVVQSALLRPNPPDPGHPLME